MPRRVGEQLLIALRERGPRVPPAQRERIFDRFRQGEGAGLALRRRGTTLRAATLHYEHAGVEVDL